MNGHYLDQNTLTCNNPCSAGTSSSSLGQYLIPGTRTCAYCGFSCNSCTDDYTCTKCFPGYYLGASSTKTVQMSGSRGSI